MTRRRVLLLGSVAVVAAVAITVGAVWPRASVISERNGNRIKDGMTPTEVEVILGGPARDETGGSWKPFHPPVLNVANFMMACYTQEWIGPDCGVLVDFCEDRVNRVSISTRDEPDETVFHKVRHWFGLSADIQHHMLE